MLLDSIFFQKDAAQFNSTISDAGDGSKLAGFSVISAKKLSDGWAHIICHVLTDDRAIWCPG